ALGEHEVTVMKTWMRAANLRRWINCPDCPEVLRQFNRLFRLYLGLTLGDEAAHKRRQPNDSAREMAHFNYQGIHFSRASAHLGNSLVSFMDMGQVCYGSIEEITNVGRVKFVVRAQPPLPAGKNAPFKPFIDFPAVTYSSKMEENTITVD